CFLSSILFFFFSSRRRHTRWPRDWSSDVCSSDLFHLPLPYGSSAKFNLLVLCPGLPGEVGDFIVRTQLHFGMAMALKAERHAERSEERRVGKECRCRWWREQ